MNNEYRKFMDISNRFFPLDEIQSYCLYEGKIENPQFTIAIPTYKKGDLAIRALKSAQNQNTNIKYDIIIIDNDEEMRYNEDNNLLLNYIKQQNDKKVSYYINEHNLGMAGNWNRCFQLAKADWVILLHSDDCLVENYFSQLKYIMNLGKYDFIAVDGIVCNSEKVPRFVNQTGEYVELKESDLIYGNQTTTCGCCINKKKFVEVGGINEYYYPCIDYHFIALCSHYMRVCKIFLPFVISYRGANTTMQVMDKIIISDYLIRNTLASIHKGFVGIFYKLLALLGNISIATYLPSEFDCQYPIYKANNIYKGTRLKKGTLVIKVNRLFRLSHDILFNMRKTKFEII